ncbi:hypothetical protein HPP92_007322 [Vanilla planifolia]|uniref:N-alpha-acetyltransferase 40 n=1 Tax=Vanilla planifolia TaxID=51239 RepID=A0A835R9Y5_VANPL|nr:hypothetical protein HPP92_007322 [Vanilla planifolia]
MSSKQGGKAKPLKQLKVDKKEDDEVLEKQKAIEEIIKSASAIKDHLTSFVAFRQYDRNGFGDQLSSPVKKCIQNLLKVNMEDPYGPEWPMEEKVKRREMVAPEARYIFVWEASDDFVSDNILTHDYRSNCQCSDKKHLVGFVHFRFTVEEDIPVTYVYELQLENCARGKGLGKFLMQLMELIACKNRMGAVMLTVQKSNTAAINFYNKLRYIISATSPSKVDPLIGVEKSYEILCKTFTSDAKSKLEEISCNLKDG